MSATPMALPSRLLAARPGTLSRAMAAFYALMAAALLAYLASLLVRHGNGSSTLLDGWAVAGFELILSVACASRALRRRQGRAIALLLGAAVGSWALGDVVLTAESLGGTPGSPSLADAFYLAFYPLAYVGLGLFVRRDVRRLVPATWLDGAVAGLGAAALCATFAFRPILGSLGGSPAAVVTDLAYPVGDVLLLALVVGATAVMPGRTRSPWILIGIACALNAVGDTFNLFSSTAGSSEIGVLFNAIAWPTAILLISLSVWLDSDDWQPSTATRTPGFLLPGLGALVSLAILIVATVRHTGPVSLGLAVATLLTVGLRLTLSVRRLRALTEQRHLQSVTDELTGLGNRRQLFQILETFFAAQSSDAPGRRLAFLFVDLNRFKEINDAFGHAAGDELLRQLGPRMSASLRRSDVLVRLGGDELGVLLMDTQPEYATLVASRILATFQEPFSINHVAVRIGASIGIAFAPQDAASTAELLHCADLAMYRAKQRPDSSFEVYSEEIDASANRLRLVEELHEAVARGEFVLHFQPQVDVRSGTVAALEALLRWPHPRLGMVPPLEFLPLAEESGLMQPLTAWVIDNALAECARWRREGSTVAVSVNISASNLVDAGFIELVRGLLARHALPASALVLEITETSIIRDFNRCQGVIAQLRDSGIAVSIDDFGAGFTSLAYLANLAVNELKLDRSFITGLAREDKRRDLALVRATIDLGHALGLRVVAEGIEDDVTMDLLARVGCDLAQGYYISKPVPADRVMLRSTMLPTAAEERVAAAS